MLLGRGEGDRLCLYRGGVVGLLPGTYESISGGASPLSPRYERGGDARIGEDSRLLGGLLSLLSNLSRLLDLLSRLRGPFQSVLLATDGLLVRLRLTKRAGEEESRERCAGSSCRVLGLCDGRTLRSGEGDCLLGGGLPLESEEWSRLRPERFE